MAGAIDTTPFNSLSDTLLERIRNADFTRTFQVIQADLEADVEGFFAAGVGPDGDVWPPLAASTVRHKHHNTLLKETGALWGSVAADDPPYAIREIVQTPSQKTFTFGTSRPFAAVHQYGSTGPLGWGGVAGRIPRRTFLGITPSRRERIRELITERCALAARGEGETL